MIRAHGNRVNVANARRFITGTKVHCDVCTRIAAMLPSSIWMCSNNLKCTHWTIHGHNTAIRLNSNLFARSDAVVSRTIRATCIGPVAANLWLATAQNWCEKTKFTMHSVIWIDFSAKNTPTTFCPSLCSASSNGDRTFCSTIKRKSCAASSK